MNVLMLSIDKTIMDQKSDTALRMKLYGKVAAELHIIVFTRIKEGKQHPVQIAPNVFAYPTNTRVSIWYFLDFYRIARAIFSKSAGRKWLITSQDAFTNIPALLLKHFWHIPLEVQIHTDFLSPLFSRESLKNYLRYMLYAFSVRRADRIRAVSERINHEIGRRYPEKKHALYVLPAFVDIQEIKKLPITVNLHSVYPQYDFIILMASRLTKEKNISFAISAFAMIAKKYPRTLLLIVGNGPEKKNLQRLVQASGLEENVIFENGVPLPLLISYYKSADLFLLTSFYEGYGRTVVEAAACALPIIMTDVGVAGELIIQHVSGRVIPVAKTEVLQEALVDAIQDYGRFQTYAEQAEGFLKKSVPDEMKHLSKLQEAWKMLQY